MSQPDSTTAADAVRTASQAVFAALAEAHDAAVDGDGDGVRAAVAAALAHFAPDARSFSPGAPAVRGVPALEAVYLHLYSTAASPRFATTPDDVLVAASGDLAALTGTFTMTAPGPDGAPSTARGKYLETWRRDDGAWRLVTGAWNLDA